MDDDTGADRAGQVAPAHTFRPTPSSWFTVFAERRDDESMHPTCLLIPSMDVGDLLIDHAGERSFTWDPDSTRRDASVAPYRIPAADLAGRLATFLEWARPSDR
ncbi:MAG TPA: hypothetical protein VIG86_10425 [Candidatus Dormibacteraeota bacterium]|jgi:hypothetical protein